MCILFIYMQSSCFYIDSEDRKYVWCARPDYVGQYKLNISRSILTNYMPQDTGKPYFNTPMHSYSKEDTAIINLKLSLNNDSTFEFSNDVPFINEKHGKWVMGGNDLDDFCVLLNSNDQVGLYTNNSIAIYAPQPKDTQPYVKYLYFDRIK